MVLFFGAASIAPTYTGPNGWTLLETKNGTTAMALRVWTRTGRPRPTPATASR